MIYSMRDLRYFLIEGKADWMANFRILESRQQLWNDCPFAVHALCTSHAVSVRCQGSEITELLSCRGNVQIGPALAELAAFRPFEIATKIHGLLYRFRLELQAPAGNDAFLGEFDPENQITVAYPRIPGLDTPVTKIGWRADSAALTIETLHTYPEEASGVRSQTSFEMAREARI